jgi:hypothetical protein
VFWQIGTAARINAAGGGFINVQNNGDHVTATVTGSGTINISNNGAAVMVTENGSGTVNVNNNGQIITATNTGNGVVTINNTCKCNVLTTSQANNNNVHMFTALSPTRQNILLLTHLKY